MADKDIIISKMKATIKTKLNNNDNTFINFPNESPREIT